MPDADGLESLLYTFPSTFPVLETESVELFFKNSETIRQLTKLPFVNGTITDVTPGVNAVVTSSDFHLLNTDDEVTIRDVVGITDINGETFTITVTSNTQFELNAEVGGAYESGGSWTSTASTRFGFFTPWDWIINIGTIQPRGATTVIPYSIPYPTGFKLYGAFLTPFTGVTQFGLQNSSTTRITMSSSQNPRFYFWIIGSGSPA